MVFLFLATIIEIRALSIVHEITGRRGREGGLDNLLMSMIVMQIFRMGRRSS
jgi:hypothetical protein